MRAADYIDKLKAARGLEHDNELVSLMPPKTTRGHLSEIRSGKRFMPDGVRAVIAKELNINELEILADLRIQSAKNHEEKKFWRSILTRASAVSALALALSVTSVVTPRAEAAQGADSGADNAPSTHYASFATTKRQALDVSLSVPPCDFYKSHRVQSPTFLR